MIKRSAVYQKQWNTKENMLQAVLLKLVLYLCAPLRQESILKWQGSCIADNIMRQIPEAMLKRQKAAHLKEANINIQRFVAVT